MMKLLLASLLPIVASAPLSPVCEGITGFQGQGCSQPLAFASSIHPSSPTLSWSGAQSPARIHCPNLAVKTLKRHAVRIQPQMCVRSDVVSAVKYYEYQGFRCAYTQKPAAKGYENSMPLLLVHPVGLGLSRWFWDRFLLDWQGGEVFVVDLIGCGESEGWDPNVKGLSVPLDWTRQLEALWREEIRRPCTVLVQGASAPLAIQMAARQSDDWDGSKAIVGVVMTSPPKWEELFDGIPQDEAEEEFVKASSFWGRLTLDVFRRRGFIRFFSDLFLFSNDGKSDEQWLDECVLRAKQPLAEWPIFAFNSGLINVNGYRDQLTTVKQPFLAIWGDEDPRIATRFKYLDYMPNCEVDLLPGKAVVPWEYSKEATERVSRFIDSLK